MKHEKWILAETGSAADFYMDMGEQEDPGLRRVMDVVCEDVYLVSGVRPILHTGSPSDIDLSKQSAFVSTSDKATTTRSNQQHCPSNMKEDDQQHSSSNMKGSTQQQHPSEGKQPQLPSSYMLEGVVAGIIGQNHLIDRWIQEGKCQGASITGKRECFSRSFVRTENGIYLCIAGSDKLGTIYGLFSLSELIGVSPWLYWGDMRPGHKDCLAFTEEEWSFTSNEPSVYYRGFFMNDEWPSLGSWATNTFGGFNELFYDHVFLLLLRLKGNYFWPAMWTGAFCMDGVSVPMANANLAQEYGITMGNSHHEPMMRASEEWDKVKSDSNDIGYGRDWNYVTNKRGLYQYWKDAIRRNKDYRNVITMGMRGERDTSMLGDFSDLSQNIELLKQIITDQKEILQTYGVADAPKLLALYKEVEDYFYGDDHTQGLKDWEGLDDILLLLSDDNYGNLRTLPTKDTADRPAGWGLYYHFDYHGGPISYEWVNSTALEKAWEQLSMAYDNGIRKLWIVNVGDLRPQELPLSFFMDLAYDYERWEDAFPTHYIQKWAKKQFASWADPYDLKEISITLNEYTRLNADCRPEATQPDTFSLLEGELFAEVQRAADLEEQILAYTARWDDDSVPEVQQKLAAMPEGVNRLWWERCGKLPDDYFGLVYFPAMASANVRLMNLYAKASQYYGEMGSGLANQYAEAVADCIEMDQTLTCYYNEGMSGGKWNGMMRSAHICFQHWNDEGWHYPPVTRIDLPKTPKMILSVEGVYEANTLPLFSNIGRKEWNLVLSNGGIDPYEFQVLEYPQWMTLSEHRGTVETAHRIHLQITENLAANEKGKLVIQGAGETVHLSAEMIIRRVPSLPSLTYLENNGYVSICSSGYKASAPIDCVGWRKLDNYGKSTDAMKMFPSTVSFREEDPSPWLEYAFYLWEGGSYEIHLYLAPTNDLQKGCGQKYKLSVDNEQPEVVDSLPMGFHAGSHYDGDWCRQVLRNDRRSTILREIAPGLHNLRLYGMDAGLILEKIVFCKVGSSMEKILPSLFYGPEESVKTTSASDTF